MTNGDVIRSMNDNELAEYFCEKLDCTRCPAEKTCKEFVEGLKNWFKKEEE